jgi:hypothetical protein
MSNYKHRYLIIRSVAAVLAVIGFVTPHTAKSATSEAAVVRIVTGKGTLIVRVDDPGVSVRVQEGEIVITGTGPKERRLQAVDFKTQDSDAGQPVGETVVTITRGEKELLNIRRETAPSTVTASTSDTESAEDTTPLKPIRRQSACSTQILATTISASMSL